MPSQSKLLGDLISAAGTVTVNGSSLLANTIANSAFQTGSVENYFNAQGLSIGRNRIINGAMEISQRNGTSATTVNGNDVYTLDRFKGWASGGGVFTVTQSTTAPTGFNNSSLITVTTADASIAAGDNYRFAQVIEGYNIADFGFGTASASTVTLSFWVRSSITGTFGGSLYSVSGTRSYVFNYTISSANIWEQKTVTIAGDTSGTWGTTNSYGITVYFDLGSGSNYENATGSWVAAEKFRTSGNATLISTLSNTLYLTGVQLEVGSTATPFERRQFGQELALCQRYYEKTYPLATVPGTAGGTTAVNFVYQNGNGRTGATIFFKVPKRATPTVTSFDDAGNSGKLTYMDNGHNFTTTQNQVSENKWAFQGPNSTNNSGIAIHCVAVAEL